MRTFLVLVCSVALASLALGAQEGKGKKKEEPKKQAAHVSQPAGKATGKRTAVGHAVRAGQPTTVGHPSGAGKAKIAGKPTGAGKPTTAGNTGFERAQRGQNKKITTAGKPAAPAGAAAAKVNPQHFNLASKPKTKVAPAVTFQQSRRIRGAQNWQGSNYTVFRNYSPQWHDRNWWGSRYNRIVFVFGSPYYWDSGYWYPAWGYYPNAYYAYDGPIYAYNDLPPDQVIANAQAALQQQGYYRGEVDGLLGPLTRAAVADYQRDHGLYITSAIDRPTLSSLGLT